MLNRLKKSKKGFTLIELIVVVAIIAILAAIAVPQFIGMQTKATRGAQVATASAIAGAVNMYNNLNTSSKKATAAVQACASQADLVTLVGSDLAPAVTGNINKACKRITVDANGVATVDTDLTAATYD